ncbi:MAG TPA: outer membrane beta-barrel protein [Lacunisphaera sp.]|nr:outer membrane beta-barrel protein [Lacunisphaera sp.]
MIRPAHLRAFLVVLCCTPGWLPSARALLNLDGTRNQVFVFGSCSFAYNSNIFADASGRGDYSSTAVAGIELKRRAGIIAVNATTRFTYQLFNKYTGQDALDPNFTIEFIKTTGRLTGSLQVRAYRESRSDSAVNLRTNSWNFPVTLSLKYPVNDKLYVTSDSDFLHQRYTQTNVLANLTEYSESVDVFYVYTSKLDLSGGYRLRISNVTLGRNSTDHWFNLGATGGLLAKLSGTVRIGYQLRETTGRNAESFTHVNAMAGLTWPMTRKLSLAGQLSRDFNTIATGSTVDATAGSVTATYAVNRKISLNTTVTGGLNKFLGLASGRREDEFFSWDLGANYRFNEHLSIAASYTYLRNWSSLAYSEFTRQGYNLDFSSRF